MKDWSGKTVVITGAASGIGEAIAHRLAREGMRVVVADIDLEQAERVVAEIIVRGAKAIAARTDVRSAADMERLAALADETFGSIDILCCNAGVVPAGRSQAVWEFTLEDWRWAFEVNVIGIIHGLRAFLPRMIAQQTRGHVTLTGSIAGLTSGSHSPVYGTTKHAVTRIAEALHAALNGRGLPIGVTLLCPGIVNTRIYDSERNRPAVYERLDGPAEESPDLDAISEELFRNAPSPGLIADRLFDAIQHGRFYEIPSRSYDRAIEARYTALLSRDKPDFGDMMAMIMDDAGLALDKDG